MNIIKLLGVLLFLSTAVNATTVQFQTSLGDFEVVLFDEGTPITVANFLDYVGNGSYSDSIVHRSDPGFVVQGGGFTVDENVVISTISANAAIQNEPVYSNLVGTIAMAKTNGGPNTATNQWFFNLANNSANLDVQNGGFTVFGQVTGNGMGIINTMASAEIFSMGSLGSAFTHVPLINYTSTDAANQVAVTAANFITIYDIVVLDGATDTLGSLTPVENTLINAPPPSSSNSGGGSASFFLLMLMMIVAGITNLRCDKPLGHHHSRLTIR